MTVLPSGEQFVLRCAGRDGDTEAVVVEVGGGLRTYRAGGRDVVDGYAEAGLPVGARGQVLAPWPNRLRDGRYRWDGAEHQTPLSEPETHNAIHGLVRTVAWQVTGRTSDSVQLEHLLHPQPGYPFALRMQIGYELSPGGLRVRTTATNVGDEPLPYGEGHHPYLATVPRVRRGAVAALLVCGGRGWWRGLRRLDRGARRPVHRCRSRRVLWPSEPSGVQHRWRPTTGTRCWTPRGSW
jgi:aldose 1-epimerase